jgi:hypothetical protein
VQTEILILEAAVDVVPGDGDFFDFALLDAIEELSKVNLGFFASLPGAHHGEKQNRHADENDPEYCCLDC